MLSVVGSLTEEQRLAALGQGGGNPIPVVFTAGGDGAGKLWTMDLTVPPAAFAGIGTLVAAGIGATSPRARGSHRSLRFARSRPPGVASLRSLAPAFASPRSLAHRLRHSTELSAC